MENMRAHGYRQQRTRLMPYVLHRVDCTINHAPFESCTCGLSVALNATDLLIMQNGEIDGKVQVRNLIFSTLLNALTRIVKKVI